MKQEIIEELELRNNRIINIVQDKIAKNCPNSVDLFAIGGSFVSGEFYEKSDLDLVLISEDDGAGCLDKCFILNDVGFDIYTHNFRSFDEMSLYHNPFVTKLIDLKIIKTSEFGLRHYKDLQKRLRESMSDDRQIEKSMKTHFASMVSTLNAMKESNDIGETFRRLADILKYAEYIIYMDNRAYVKGGVKKIPSEIASMERIPKGFLELYNNIVFLSDRASIEMQSLKLVTTIEEFLGYNMSRLAEKETRKVSPKKEIKPKNLIGTYEEIYSNWYNKMIHAVSTRNTYLSFVTMAGCQEFYDEMFEEFDIPRIELINKYNPNSLENNVKSFEFAMEEWKKLYDKFGASVERYKNLEDFEKAYLNN